MADGEVDRSGAAGGEVDPDDLAAAVWRALVGIFLARRDRFVALADEAGISPPHLHALDLIERNGPWAMRELARELRCDASNVTAIVDRLESRRLVRRRTSPSDRRVKLLELTEEGGAAVAQLRAALYEPPAALRGLDPADAELLGRLAERLAADLDPPVPRRP